MPKQGSTSDGTDTLQVTTISLPTEIHSQLKRNISLRKLKGERGLSMAAHIETLIRKDLNKAGK